MLLIKSQYKNVSRRGLKHRFQGVIYNLNLTYQNNYIVHNANYKIKKNYVCVICEKNVDTEGIKWAEEIKTEDEKIIANRQ